MAKDKGKKTKSERFKDIFYPVIMVILTAIFGFSQYITTKRQTQIAFLDHLSKNSKYKDVIDQYYSENIGPYEVYDEIIKGFETRSINFEKSKDLSIFSNKCMGTDSIYLFVGTYDKKNKKWTNSASSEISKMDLEKINELNEIKTDEVSGIRKGYPVENASNYEYCESLGLSKNGYKYIISGKDLKEVKRRDDNYDIWVKIILPKNYLLNN